VTTESFKEDCERWIYIARSGPIVFESTLKKTHDFSLRDWDHLMAIIEDHIELDDEGEKIVWPEVWREWDRDQEGPQS
jgi:hypothetical protein